ncbi:hypothetical protein BKA70DRAFT_1493935 [Coprinopsis sp. MPI-PUGE-AT-0042]|nr:hypothetical protein BKA70DRAFT_1493935 [Coprinopsis sp. MPI-PUGE-AT-0042]
MKGIQNTVDCAHLTQGFFARRFNPEHLLQPKTFDYKVQAECHQIAAIVAQARSNPVVLPWTVLDYVSGNIPPSTATYASRVPTLFVDREGAILWWFLPGVIQEHRQEIMRYAVHQLFVGDKAYADIDTGNSEGGRPSLYTHPSCDYGALGRVDVSLWPQGLGGEAHASDAGGDFLEAMAGSFAILGAIQAITAPGVFDIAIDIATQLSCHVRSSAIDERNAALAHWAVPATNVSVACNQDAPIARADDLEPMTYSLVATLGSYILSKFQVPDLNFHCHDSPGTVMVGMMGLFPHGFARGDGNRITLTAYTPRNTLEETATITKNNCSHQFFRASPLLLSTYDRLVQCDPYL